MTDSDYLYRIIRWLRASGVKVHAYAYDLPCAGMYRSETREVFLNEATARGALLTLAHEAGHWLGYVCFGEKKHSYQRERQAFVYGWRVLVMVGADRAVSRVEWIQAELDRRAVPGEVSTAHVPSREESDT